MNNLKLISLRILCIMLALSMLCTLLTACSDDGQERDDRPALAVWVLSEDYKTDIERAFNSAFTSTDWRIDVRAVSSAEVDKAFASADMAAQPDVFMLAPNDLCRYIEGGIAADMASLGITLDENRYYPYTIEAGTDSQGVLRAVCLEPDPGLFFYRRSLAKYYLGTDDPDEIQPMLNSWEGFLDTARQLGEASSGKTYMLAGIEDMMMAFLADVPFVADGRLVIDERAEEFIDYCAELGSQGFICNAEQWSDAWVAGMSDPQSIFGYFSSGLGMSNVLIPACGGSISGEGSFGDWGAVPGPAPYNWGGCWLAVSERSRMRAQAAQFLEYFICEEEAMRTNCLISGAFSANRTVVEQIKFDSQFSESFLSAQNSYSLLAQVADGVSMRNLNEYDAVIKPVFARCISRYVFGFCSREQALEDFAKTVQAAYPELIAE